VVWIGVGGVCGRGVAFAASIALAHMLGPAAFGVLAFGLSVAVVFSACAGLGLDELLVREFARRPRDSRGLFADTLILRLGAIPIGVGGALLLTSVYSGDTWLGVTLALYAILNSCLLSACATFRGRARMDIPAVLIGGQAVLIGLMATAMAWLTASAQAVAGAYAFGAGAFVLVAFWLLARTGAQPRFGWRPHAWRRLARVSAPFAVGAIGLLALDRVALAAITLTCGAQAAGWFGAVHTIILGLSGLATTATIVAFPRLARAAVDDPRAASSLVGDLLIVALAVGVTLSAALYFLASSLVLALFGADYTASIAILQRIAFSLPAVFVTIVLVGAFEATDRQWQSARAIATALPAAAVLCVGATWVGGLDGGAIAYTAAHVVLAGLLAARWLFQPRPVVAPHRVPVSE
jgi:O-antigen/teichoic acid export membrane protein